MQDNPNNNNQHNQKQPTENKPAVPRRAIRAPRTGDSKVQPPNADVRLNTVIGYNSEGNSSEVGNRRSGVRTDYVPAARPTRKRKASKPLMTALVAIIVALSLLIVWLGYGIISELAGSGKKDPDVKPAVSGLDTSETGEATTTTAAPVKAEPKEVASATIGNSGDILVHLPVLRAAKTSGGSYDFDYMFEYLTPYNAKLDYSAINVELSIATSGFETQEMVFRIPSTIIDATAKSGYNLGLLANNHIWNNGSAGYGLTIDALDNNSMDHIGLRRSTSEKRYLVKDINGIKIGMTNYVYGEATDSNSLLNRFDASNPDGFYADAEKQIADMRADGAEAIVFYMHWGIEYNVTPSTSQKQMAQKLCDLGVDVIIGGHPHKVQPVELLTSDNGNQTVCLYSMGNMVSNQTIEAMYGGSSKNSKNFQDGGVCVIPDVRDRYSDTKWDQHDVNCNDNGDTEDGVLFTYKFTKYDDGTVLLSEVGVLPTWSYRFKDSSRTQGYGYKIVPLDKSVSDWGTQFDIAEIDLVFAERSYDRTMNKLSEGIQASNAACAAKLEAFKESYAASH